MSYDRKYLVWALGYVVAGICLGIFMAATHNHGELVAHAHINLVGFLLSIGYGIIHKLWLGKPNPAIARIQFIVHQAASITMFVGLFLYYGNFVPAEQLDPILGISAIAVLGAALLMLYMAIKSNTATSELIL
jgi:hypothetical protein